MDQVTKSLYWALTENNRQVWAGNGKTKSSIIETIDILYIPAITEHNSQICRLCGVTQMFRYTTVHVSNDLATCNYGINMFEKMRILPSYNFYTVQNISYFPVGGPLGVIRGGFF